jgi:hypothetical protein
VEYLAGPVRLAAVYEPLDKSGLAPRFLEAVHLRRRLRWFLELPQRLDIDDTSGNHLHVAWRLRRQLDRKDLEFAAGRLGPRMYGSLRDNDQVAGMNLTLFVA